MMPVAAHAQKTIKLAHLNKNDPFDNGTGAMAVVFKSLVESGTNGAVKVDIFPDGQLGKDNEVIQQVKSGVVQSSISSVGGIASVYPMIGILDVPFAYPNIATTYEVPRRTVRPETRRRHREEEAGHEALAGDTWAASSPSPTPSARSSRRKTWKRSEDPHHGASNRTSRSSAAWAASR